jgi:hypothetical protein
MTLRWIVLSVSLWEHLKPRCRVGQERDWSNGRQMVPVLQRLNQLAREDGTLNAYALR